MIVVIGHPRTVTNAGRVLPAGTAARAALSAAARGAAVQLIGKVGDDDAGDRLLLELGQAGVGHVALLRDPSHRTPDLVPPPGNDEAGILDDLDGVMPARVPDVGAAAPALDAGDVDLGLRYLPDFAVLVLAEPLHDDIVRVAADAARYSGAALVVVTDGRGYPAGVPPEALVLEAPETDPEGSFATLVGELAAAIDAGATPRDALGAVAARLGAVRPAD